jgi:uncharacterized SAM-binding protein YcdF (DUF218 family)
MKYVPQPQARPGPLITSHQAPMKRAMPVSQKALALLALAGLAWGLWLVYLVWAIHKQSTLDEARPADVIVIMGAAEYRGAPSPVYRARLDHGLDLYRRGLAPRLLTTGGAGGDPVYTEAEVGRAYLVRQGVKSENILVEPEGESTVHSTAGAAEIMRQHHMGSCILVSDGYHIYRSKRMLEFRGLTVYGSPRPTESAGRPLWRLYLRQAVGYTLWSLGITI